MQRQRNQPMIFRSGAGSDIGSYFAGVGGTSGAVPKEVWGRMELEGANEFSEGFSCSGQLEISGS